MKVLVACESSGTVRDAFLRLGHDAMSCDLLPTDVPGPHHHGSVLDILGDGWDLMIAHPPCTHIAVSGAAWFEEKRKDGRQAEAIAFFMKMINAPIPHICVENPVCIMSTVYQRPSQIIHPWQFGHPEQKTTCLWTKGLKRLRPTNVVYDEMMKLPKNERERIHYLPPGPDRWKERSKTFQGIADAMADQWGVPGSLIPEFTQTTMFLSLIHISEPTRPY